MKKIITSLVVIFFVLNLKGQEQGKIRVGLDVGLGIPNRGIGVSGAFDVRYNILDNWNVGLKTNYGMLNKDIVNQSNISNKTSELVLSVLGVSDYYFINTPNKIVPYIGIGLGQNYFQNIMLSLNGSTQIVNYGIAIDEKFGGVLRGGFEFKHFRMALEYYIIPASDLVNSINWTVLGATKNSYANLTIGFYIGGGKWK